MAIPELVDSPFACGFGISGSISPTNSWLLTGNAGTNPNVNFLGTTDAQDLVLRTNSIQRVRIATAGDTIISGPTPWIDVRAHGAVGDGVTDDGPAIRLAATFLPADGGVLYFPGIAAGTAYLMDSSVVLSDGTPACLFIPWTKRNVVIKGDAQVKTWIKRGTNVTPDTHLIAVEVNPTVNYQVLGPRIESIFLDGNGDDGVHHFNRGRGAGDGTGNKGACGYTIRSTNAFNFKGLTARGVFVSGFYNGIHVNNCVNFKIEDCSFLDNGAFFNVTAAADAAPPGTGIKLTLKDPNVASAAGHDFQVNDGISISSVTGNTAANGYFIVAAADATTVTIKNPDGTFPASNGGYAGGGVASDPNSGGLRIRNTTNMDASGALVSGCWFDHSSSWAPLVQMLSGGGAQFHNNNFFRGGFGIRFNFYDFIDPNGNPAEVSTGLFNFNDNLFDSQSIAALRFDVQGVNGAVPTCAAFGISISDNIFTILDSRGGTAISVPSYTNGVIAHVNIADNIFGRYGTTNDLKYIDISPGAGANIFGVKIGGNNFKSNFTSADVAVNFGAVGIGIDNHVDGTNTFQGWKATQPPLVTASLLPSFALRGWAPIKVGGSLNNFRGLEIYAPSQNTGAWYVGLGAEQRGNEYRTTISGVGTGAENSSANLLLQPTGTSGAVSSALSFRSPFPFTFNGKNLLVPKDYGPVTGLLSGYTKAIGGVTLGNPTIITITDHGVQTGDYITLTGELGVIAGNVGLINGTFVATKTGANTFTVPVNSGAATAWSSTGLMVRPLSVTGAVAVGGPDTRILVTTNNAGAVKAHGLANQTVVTIYGVTGTTEANGTWVIDTTVGTATQFALVGSTFTNAFVGAGSLYADLSYPEAMRINPATGNLLINTVVDDYAYNAILQADRPRGIGDGGSFDTDVRGGWLVRSTTITNGNFYKGKHSGSTYTGNAISLDMAKTNGVFTGNFLYCANNNDAVFYVDSTGATFIKGATPVAGAPDGRLVLGTTTSAGPLVGGGIVVPANAVGVLHVRHNGTIYKVALFT